MASLPVARHRMVIRPWKKLILPKYKGSTFRGGFGEALKQAVCVMDHGECWRCLLKKTCSYPYIFDTPTPQGTSLTFRNNYQSHPYVIEPPDTEQEEFTSQDVLNFHLILMGRSLNYFPYCISAFDLLDKIGLGRGRGKYALEEVWYQERGKADVLIYSGKSCSLPETLPTLVWSDEEEITNEGEKKVEIEFLTPTRIRYEERFIRCNLEFPILIRAILSAISRLMEAHQGTKLEKARYVELVEAAKHVTLIHEELQWLDWERYSNRQRTRMRLGGVVGKVSYQGPLGAFLPYLYLAEYTHVGKNTSFGLGKIRIQG